MSTQGMVLYGDIKKTYPRIFIKYSSLTSPMIWRLKKRKETRFNPGPAEPRYALPMQPV